MAITLFDDLLKGGGPVQEPLPNHPKAADPPDSAQADEERLRRRRERLARRDSTTDAP
jgi:hypothetical protein